MCILTPNRSYIERRFTWRLAANSPQATDMLCRYSYIKLTSFVQAFEDFPSLSLYPVHFSTANITKDYGARLYDLAAAEGDPQGEAKFGGRLHFSFESGGMS